MNQTTFNKYSKMILPVIAVLVVISLGFSNIGEQHSEGDSNTKENSFNVSNEMLNPIEPASMPVYGNWKNFTKKDGLPGDKTYCVKIDGDRVLVGTHEGLGGIRRRKMDNLYY